jgi:hypothetical protein
MKDDVFEIYVRNQDGDTHFASLRNGLREFLDAENGYRLSINIDGVRITLRKGSVSDELRYLDSMIEDQTSLDCAVTILGLTASN